MDSTDPATYLAPARYPESYAAPFSALSASSAAAPDFAPSAVAPTGSPDAQEHALAMENEGAVRIPVGTTLKVWDEPLTGLLAFQLPLMAWIEGGSGRWIAPQRGPWGHRPRSY